MRLSARFLAAAAALAAGAAWAQVPDGRERLIEYLVANFHELVYV